MLSRDQILAQSSLPIERVSAFGGEVFVCTMSGLERDAFEVAYEADRKAGKPVNVRGALAVRTLCDQQGNRLFTDDDLDAVSGLSARELDKVFSVAQRLNGIGADDVKELEGNSAATTDAASSSS